MVSDFPAGLTRESIEMVMNLDDAVISFDRVNDEGSMWRATVSVDGRDPVDLIVDNGINPVYVQALARIDYDEITPYERNLCVTAAVAALGPYATVGIAEIGSSVYLRSAFFIDHSTIHAFTNTLRALALAHAAYLAQLPITASALAT